MNFRPLTPADVPAAYQLLQAIFKHLEVPLITALGPEQAAQVLQQAMLKPNFRYGFRNGFAIEVDGQLATCAFAYPGAWEPLIDAPLDVVLHDNGLPPMALYPHRETIATDFYIDSIVTAEPFRRQGYARRLIQQLATVAATLGYQTLALNCDQNNKRALTLYRSLDFEIMTELMIGGSPHYYLVHQID